MANLGSDNTPIEGESFGLPSGFSIDENNGNLAIRDTNGNVVAEWDDTNAQWDFANNTLNNVDALNSNSVNTESLDIGSGDGEGGIEIEHPETGEKFIWEPDGTLKTRKGNFDIFEHPDTPRVVERFEFDGEEAIIEIPDAAKVEIHFEEIRHGDVACRFSDDGGQSFYDDSGDYAWVGEAIANDGDGYEDGGAVRDQIVLAKGVTTATNVGPFTLTLNNVRREARTRLDFRGTGQTGDGLTNFRHSGEHDATVETDAIKIFEDDDGEEDTLSDVIGCVLIYPND